ncbi:heterokaryon incompatibility protein-domain-containing protein [Xylaria flabelliformis]|nr:heterokaryon incompatibility protein-domain-containing protein [Xylaria flabelliformis]
MRSAFARALNRALYRRKTNHDKENGVGLEEGELDVASGNASSAVTQPGDSEPVHGQALHTQREQSVAAVGVGLTRDDFQDDETIASIPQSSLNVGAIDPCWINLNEIQQWIHTCTTCHSKTCETAAVVNSETRGPLWLVDVKNECIVPAEAHRYIALSYVWGNAGGTEATREIMDILQHPGALSVNGKQVTVPKTVRHAMVLVNLLGESYLWVDRFCICQDDLESKHVQLALMGHIFEGAYFTIIAANGWDADQGLRGIKGFTEPRNISSQLLSEGEYMSRIDHTRTLWYSRGWTYQEMLLSPRKLFFLYGNIVWECSDAIWHEATGITGSFPIAIETDPIRAKLEAYPKRWLPKRSFRSADAAVNPVKYYIALIRQYNSRELTFPEDGLNAFMGITTKLTDYFPDGFLWGLPIALFDIALLWQPGEDMAQRCSKRDDALQLPSWSWVGWQGLINDRYFDEEYAVETSLAAPHTPTPTADSVSVPKITPICKFASTDNGTTGNAVTVSTGGDNRIASIRQPSPILLVYGPIAKCKLAGGRTSAVGFGGHMAVKWISEPSSTDGSERYSTSTDGSERYGIMPMPPNLFSVTGDVECELLALSSAISAISLEEELILIGSFHDHPRVEQFRRKGLQEYHNVLWITRKDGIAYRQGLGKISTIAWEHLSPEWEQIQLG